MFRNSNKQQQTAFAQSMCFKATAAALLMLAASVTNAAAINKDQLNALVAEAKQNGHVGVQILLAKVSLDELASNSQSVKSDICWTLYTPIRIGNELPRGRARCQHRSGSGIFIRHTTHISTTGFEQ